MASPGEIEINVLSREESINTTKDINWTQVRIGEGRREDSRKQGFTASIPYMSASGSGPARSAWKEGLL